MFGARKWDAQEKKKKHGTGSQQHGMSRDKPSDSESLAGVWFSKQKIHALGDNIEYSLHINNRESGMTCTVFEEQNIKGREGNPLSRVLEMTSHVPITPFQAWVDKLWMSIFSERSLNGHSNIFSWAERHYIYAFCRQIATKYRKSRSRGPLCYKYMITPRDAFQTWSHYFAYRAK